jgi:hypothetical protein
MKWGSDGGCGSRRCSVTSIAPASARVIEIVLESRLVSSGSRRRSRASIRTASWSITSESNASGPPIVPRAPLVVIDTEERVSSRRSTK